MTPNVDQGNTVPLQPKSNPLIKGQEGMGITMDPTTQTAYVKQIQDELKRSEEETPVKKGTYGLTPDAPQLPAPNKEVLKNFQETVKDLKGNPWFAKGTNYLSTLWAVTNEIVNLKRKTRYNESMVSLKVTQSTLELSKSIAEVTRASYNDQAMEKMTEAVSSFVSASISVVQLGKVTQNIGRAETKVADDIQKLKTEHDTLKKGPEKAADNSPPDPVAHQAKLDAAEKALAKAEAKKSESIRQETQHNDQLVQLGADIQKQSVQAASSMIVALLKFDEGKLESLKQLLEGGMQIMRSYLDKTTRTADEEKADISKVLDSYGKNVADNVRAHQLGRN